MAVSSGYTVLFLAWETGVCYEMIPVSPRMFLLNDANNDSQYCYICLKTLSEAHYIYYLMKVNVLVSPLCLTLYNPIDCACQALCSWDSPGKNTGVGSHFLLQGIFPTQGLNPCLQHFRQTLYHLSHQGSLQQPWQSSSVNYMLLKKTWEVG